MNPRIEQLAEECWTRTIELVSGESPRWEFDRNRFAELIVRACAEQVKNLRVNDYGISGAEIIREYFGVES